MFSSVQYLKFNKMTFKWHSRLPSDITDKYECFKYVTVLSWIDLLEFPGEGVSGITFQVHSSTVPSDRLMFFSSFFRFNLQTTSVQGFVPTVWLWAYPCSRTRLAEDTFVLRLCADPPWAVEQVSQCVDLWDRDGEHDKQVDAGPERDPPQVVLEKVAVPGLKGPQGHLDLAAPLQMLVNKLQPFLSEESTERETGGDESQCWDLQTWERMTKRALDMNKTVDTTWSDQLWSITLSIYRCIVD